MVMVGHNQMSWRCFVLFLTVLIVTIRASLGDVFVPKSGATVEGVAIEQDEAQFIVRPYAGNGGTVTFLRTDLAEVLPDPQETVEFLALRAEAEINTAWSSALFPELLERKIPAFELKYPSTKFRSDLSKIIDGLKAEQLRLANGSVKIAGVWIDHDQLNRAKYQVSAAMLQEAMASAEARGDWTSALNAFQNLRVNFPASRGYVEGIEIAIRVLPRLRKLEEEKLQRYRLDLLRLNLSLVETPSHLRAELAKAAHRESEGIEAAIANQRERGIRWPTLFPHSEKGFEEMYQQITEEIAELAKLPRNRYRESIDAAVGALQCVEQQDAGTAETFLKKAAAAWPENEMCAGISESIQKIRCASITSSTQKAEAPQASPLLILKNNPRSICAGGAAFCFLLATVIVLRRTQRSHRRYIG
jgi:hypothetical protein